MCRANTLATLVLAAAAAGMWTYTIVRAERMWEVPLPFIFLATTLSVAACLGWVLLWLSQRRGDGETHCRKCNYILRGLSEPRCPECGERI